MNIDLSLEEIKELIESPLERDYHLVTGSEEHMKSVEEEGLWGLSTKYESHYSNDLKEGDVVFFYVADKGLCYIGIVIKKLPIFKGGYDPASKYWKTGYYPFRFLVKRLKLAHPLTFKELNEIYIKITSNKRLPVQGSIKSINKIFALTIIEKILKDKNIAIEKSGEFLNLIDKVILSCWLTGKHPILWGKPGSGKTYAAFSLAKNVAGGNNYEIFTMHGEVTHYDLVGYFDDKGEFQRRAIAKAISEGKKIIILDEINRGNLDLALGPLFTYLDVQYADRGIELFGESLKNVRFVGTMNPKDRALLFQLGFALRRRFPLVPFDEIRKYEGEWGEEREFTMVLNLDENERRKSLESYLKEVFQSADYLREFAGLNWEDILNASRDIHVAQDSSDNNLRMLKTLIGRELLDLEDTYIIYDLYNFAVMMKALGVKNEKLIWDIGISSFLLPHLDSLSYKFFSDVDRRSFEDQLKKVKDALETLDLKISAKLIGNFLESKRSILR